MSASPAMVEAVFIEALELPTAERATFVERRCAEDPALKAKVERLLQAHEETAQQGFLEPTTISMRGPSQPEPAFHPAARFGRYWILYEIGHGGMGVVYAAYDEELQRKVAVKVVRLGAHIPGAAERLMQEAKALARLQHPNVVAVHDVGTAEGGVFVAMELVDGQSLLDWARSRSPMEVLQSLVAAGKGLAHAHGEGILHRDFKPANVLVDKSGRVRVVDFGLAADERLAALDSAPMGTPGFMAPEILKGDPATVASDVYAYCQSLSVLVLNREDRPPWLEPLVAKGLSAAAAGRWASVEELLSAIERELNLDPEQDPRHGQDQRRKVYMLFASVVLAVPAVAYVAKISSLGLRETFYAMLAPPTLIALFVAAFWRSMSATAFNRQRTLSLLIGASLFAIHRGLTLRIGPVPGAFCADLLLVAAFMAGGAVRQRGQLMWGAAGVWTLGAIAVSAFPMIAPYVFVGATVAQLPFIYLEWASRASTASLVTRAQTVPQATPEESIRSGDRRAPGALRD